MSRSSPRSCVGSSVLSSLFRRSSFSSAWTTTSSTSNPTQQQQQQFKIFFGVDHDELDTEPDVFRLCFLVSFVLANFCLQASLLHRILRVVAPGVRAAQVASHREVFDFHGNFLEGVWEDWDHYYKLECCGIEFASHLVEFAILWLCAAPLPRDSLHV
eukprot:NODE_784_length_1363_cov_272.945719.p3 GENE.NODE_784_length_1363_cov_272.945719~~NODE_784_length_1363_cov_272.945719.p3  ORF type:complete len:158 (-),score=19.94 NODE_784_length_1363_cov_272.945719:669-1142(-)